MLQLKKIYFLFIIHFGLLSCSKVVDVDVPNGGERLIIEASLNWEKGTSGNEQTILLSLSTPYYSTNKFTPANNAQVTVTNTDNQSIFTFTESEPGIYTTNTFEPVIGANYQLQVVYNANTYQATEVLYAVPEIKEVEQALESEFGSENIQVTAYVEDPMQAENYYYSEFWLLQDRSLLGRGVESDELSNGNDIAFEQDNEDFTSGDQLEIIVYGVGKGYYNFMNLLLEQSEGGGGPFSTIPAKLIGNCVNITNPNQETLGYFRLSESTKVQYTIQ